ncbi:MAG: HAD-IIB family hydrolase [Chromatiales bacterium]|nr:HAD-IIB family hydrolase [Gammaproteobacteria bacterium]MCP5352302.1 HAD-IIB family hydrolase [Chromatiales bacterium]
MRILATDLDRTLLPNGRWPADDHAIELFNRLTVENDITVVYVTGRNPGLTDEAIAEFGVRSPDILIGDVGTSIRHYTGDGWKAFDGWEEHVRRRSPRWDANIVRKAAGDIEGLVEQPRERCGPFKQSYFLDHDARGGILASVDARIKGRYDEVIIYSHDPQSGDGLLDFLPHSATKQTALEYVADRLGVPRAEVVFCGDSGNDVFPLTAGFSGVMVRNADAQLVAEVRAALAANPALRVYHATGGFMGLNGYYTGGVLEGANHYGLLPSPNKG